jgi:hypothetical protein
MSCKFINSALQIFPHFIPEMPFGFMSDIVQGYPYLFGLNPTTTAIWLVSFIHVTKMGKK